LIMKYLALTFLLALSASAPPLWAAEPKPKAKPNVLFIAVDDLNHWVGYLGRNGQVKTPNLDRLARRGVRFTHSYCASPLCNPSRTAVLSGLRPSTSGVYGNGHDWRKAVPAGLTLTTAFRNNAYFVAGAGKVYHDQFRRDSEWDAYLPKGGDDPRPRGNDTGVGGNRGIRFAPLDCADEDMQAGGGPRRPQPLRFAPLDCADEDMQDYRTVNWALGQLKRKHDRPFFLACGLYKPHLPWYVPRKYYDLYPLARSFCPRSSRPTWTTSRRWACGWRKTRPTTTPS
jgi:arylsulfatase A-like enzyme